MKSMKKLSVAIAALAISGALVSPATAIPNEDIAKVRELIEANKGRELGVYLAGRGDAVFDDSPLGQLLLTWFQWTLNSGDMSYYSDRGWDGAIPGDMVAMLEAAKTDSSLY